LVEPEPFLVLPSNQHTLKGTTRTISGSTKQPAHPEGRTRTISGPTKQPAHPEDEDRVSRRNVRKHSQVDTDVCQGKFHLKEEIVVEKQFGKYQQVI